MTIERKSNSFLIAARASNGAIGYQGTIPWHAPHDLKQFASLTRGAILIMGRATFESLPGPLPGRVSIELGSRRPSTDAAHWVRKIGRATCRGRVCQFVCISWVAVSLKKKKAKKQRKH